MRNHINRNIKHREMFRPFAPMVLEKYSKKYFGIDNSPFMLRAGPCKKPKLMPAINHVDKTARVQTINKTQNKKIYEIIEEFYRNSKIPVILNTSFNDAGEPLVENHIDAIISFLKTNLDYLVIEDICISKIDILNKKKLLKGLINLRDKRIKIDYINAKKIVFNLIDETKELSNIKKRNRELISFLKDEKYKVFDDFFSSIKKNKNYLVIGSNDHTNVLFKKFSSINLKKKKLFYLEIDRNDNPNLKRKRIKNLKKLSLKESKRVKWHSILISSHQHKNYILNNFIQNDKSKKNYKQIFIPYKNYLRSITDIN